MRAAIEEEPTFGKRTTPRSMLPYCAVYIVVTPEVMTALPGDMIRPLPLRTMDIMLVTARTHTTSVNATITPHFETRMSPCREAACNFLFEAGLMRIV
jgi:hypothetical protein